MVKAVHLPTIPNSLILCKAKKKQGSDAAFHYRKQMNNTIKW